MKIEVVEMFPGGGTLLEAMTTGLRQGGATVTVAGLIELNTRYLGMSAKSHPEATTFNASAGTFHPAELSVPRNEAAKRIFVAGIPCTGASPAGLSKNGLTCAEEHPDVGYLFLPTIHYIRLHKPEMVVLENTNNYKGTLSARLLRDALTASGYAFEERIVNPFTEFETPSQRKRWILVASRIGRFSWVYKAKRFASTLASYLDPVSPQDDLDSATPEQVAADAKYCARKKAEGCGFAMTLIDHNSTKVGVFPKSYGKRQPTGTFVRTAKGYRMVRPREIARIHGFKRELFADLPKTTQYELYGQGVVASPFISLGEALAKFTTGEQVIEAVGQLELAV